MSKITLKNPIKRGDKNQIDSIELREPTAGDLRGLKLLDIVQLDVNALSELLPRISTPALTKPELRAMNLADFTALGNGLGEFFAGNDESPQP